MTAQQIMTELEKLGNPSIKKILLNHGVREPFFGVKVGDMKPIQKKIKRDYQLARDLYSTGNADAQYLAGLIADDAKMSKADLQTWVEQALSQNISEYTVPWVAAGWSTLANLVSLQPDEKLDLPGLKALLARVVKTVHSAPNRTRYTMCSFMICLGAYVKPLSAEAIAVAGKIGPVNIDVGNTDCKVPRATDYIQKAIDRGSLTKKKKTVKC